MPADAGFVGPAQDGVRGKLRAVVADDGRRPAALTDDVVQLPRDPPARQRRVGHQGQAFARAVVDHSQEPETPSDSQLVSIEMQAPAITLRVVRYDRIT